MYTNHPILLHSFIWVVKQGILHVPPPPPPPTPPPLPIPSKTVIHIMPALSNLQSVQFIGTLYLYFFPFPSTLQNSQHPTCAFKLHDSQREHTYTHASPSLTNSINQAHSTCTSAKPPLIHRTNLAQHTSASPSLIHRINQAQHTHTSVSPLLIHRINQAQHTLLLSHSSSIG